MDNFLTAEVISQIFIGLATIILTVSLFVLSRTHLKAEFARSLHENWMQVNAALLQSPYLAKLCDEAIFCPIPSNNDENEYRKRHIIFMFLNILEADYKGYEANLTSKEVLDQALDSLLKPGYQHKMALLKLGGFGPDFIQYCEDRYGTSVLNKEHDPYASKDPYIADMPIPS